MASGPIFPAAWQIPVDFIVRKGYPGLTRGDLTVYDAYGNLTFRVRSRCLNSSPWRAKTLVDAVGNPLITCVRHQGCHEGLNFTHASHSLRWAHLHTGEGSYSVFETGEGSYSVFELIHGNMRNSTLCTDAMLSTNGLM